MCGIAGIINFNKTQPDRLEMEAVSRSLRHRGPDGSGELFTRQAAMIMRRLSIIDVAGGNQPLFNENKTIAVVGNGEIYNYPELQKYLRQRGHKLATGSDIETAVHLYEDYGYQGFRKMRGMFALAVLDTRKNEVVLIRDRMGEKPLYYTETNEGVAFASEMKAIIKFRHLNKDLNPAAINNYFHYYYVPEPETIFSGVNKLGKGEMLIINSGSRKITRQKYWDPDPAGAIDWSDPVSGIRTNFEKACELCLRSDVPVGLALSGGIDSGSILAMIASKYKTNTFKTFSVGYPGYPPSDERTQAGDLARRFKVQFYEAEVENRNVVDNFPQLVWDGDDPIADIAGSSINEVYKLAHEHGIKVLLGGLGGDELFWGYDWIRQAMVRGENANFYSRTPGYRTAEMFISKCYGKLIKPNEGDKYFMAESTDKVTLARQAMKQVRDVWLVSNCIDLNDRLSMANSVELRSPFLDYRLVETVLKSGPILSSYNQEPKYWFKKAVKDILPDQVLTRPKKGFTPPVSVWLRLIIARYGKLLPGGWLEENDIIHRSAIRMINHTWPTMPFFWYGIYQMILLELWGRMYTRGETPKQICQLSH